MSSEAVHDTLMASPGFSSLSKRYYGKCLPVVNIKVILEYTIHSGDVPTALVRIVSVNLEEWNSQCPAIITPTKSSRATRVLISIRMQVPIRKIIQNTSYPPRRAALVNSQDLVPVAVIS